MTIDLIVTRHRGAVEWLQSTLGESIAGVPVRAEVSAQDVAGKAVVGNLPMHLAAQAASVLIIEFAGPPPRGAELSADDMRRAGARLQAYIVSTA